VSRASSVHICGFVSGPTLQKVTAVASRWQRVEDLIGSGFESEMRKHFEERIWKRK